VSLGHSIGPYTSHSLVSSHPNCFQEQESLRKLTHGLIVQVIFLTYSPHIPVNTYYHSIAIEEQGKHTVGGVFLISVTELDPFSGARSNVTPSATTLQSSAAEASAGRRKRRRADDSEAAADGAIVDFDRQNSGWM